jgi:Zn-dependent metalloprotease
MNKNIKMLIILLIITFIVTLISYFGLQNENDSPVEKSNSGQIKDKNNDEDDCVDCGANKLTKQKVKAKELPYVENEIPERPVVTSQKQAEQVVKQQQNKLKLGQGSKLNINGSTKDKYGNEYYQLEQKYKGIPVWGAKSVLEIEQGKAVALTGTWLKNIELEITPKHTVQEALNIAFNDLGASETIEFDEIEGQELIVYMSNNDVHLAWYVDIYFKQTHRKPESILVDAHNPRFLLRLPRSNH